MFKCCINACSRKIITGQRMFHMVCGEKCTGYCDKCDKQLDQSSAICFICRENMIICVLCKKMHLKNIDCNGCGTYRCYTCMNEISKIDANAC